ncbi:autotransporter outer membrane beta-barrel domain-containing protein, partial [Escherichia coli]
MERRASNGDSAINTTINGGLQTVFGGGSVSGTLINNGEQRVSSGGSVINTTINGGLQTVFGGGNVSGTLINNGE